MNDLSEYISQTREQGYTDAQIRQMLISTGWTEAEIAPFFTDTPPVTPTSEETAPPVLPPTEPNGPTEVSAQVIPPGESAPEIIPPLEASPSADIPAQKPPFKPVVQAKIIPLIAAVMLFFIVLLIGIGLLLTRRGTPTTTNTGKQATASAGLSTPVPTKPQEISEPITASAGAALVVYTKTKTATGSAYMVYSHDLTTGTSQEFTQDVLGDSTGIIRLCQWSPDGSSLPILAYDSAKKKAVIWNYQPEKAGVEQLADITRNPNFPEIATGFGSKCRWGTQESLILTTRTDGDAQPVTNRRIEMALDGSVTESSDSPLLNKYQFKNMVLNEGPSDEDMTQKGYTLTLEEATQVLSLKEQPVGEAQAGFISFRTETLMIENLPATASAQLQNYVSDYQRAATEEADIEVGATIPVYTIVTYPAKLEQIYPVSPGWKLLDAIIYPDGKQLITREIEAQQDQTDTVATRFYLYNPEAGTKKLIAEQNGRYEAPSYTPSKSYLISADGKWLVTARYGAQTQIVGYELATNEAVIVCEANCRSFEMYDASVPLHSE